MCVCGYVIMHITFSFRQSAAVHDERRKNNKLKYKHRNYRNMKLPIGVDT